jgi:hypothetical protein
MTEDEYKRAIKQLRFKTVREFAREHPEMTWAEIERTFACYDAGRRYTCDTEPS